MAADGDVRKSGDAGGGLGKSYLFCLTGMRSGFANWKQSNITSEADYIFTNPKDILLLF